MHSEQNLFVNKRLVLKSSSCLCDRCASIIFIYFCWRENAGNCQGDGSFMYFLLACCKILSTCGELFSSQCNASITYLGATVELETHVGLSFVRWSLISWAQLLHKVRPLIFLALSLTHNSGSNCFRWCWCYIKCGYCFWMGLFQRKPLWQRYQRKGLRFQLQPQELAVKWTWVSWERFFEDKLEYHDTFPRCLQPGYVQCFLFKGQLE